MGFKELADSFIPRTEKNESAVNKVLPKTFFQSGYTKADRDRLV